MRSNMARILIVIAIVMLIYAAAGRVANMPLMSERRTMMILGSVLFVAGMFLTVIRRRT